MRSLLTSLIAVALAFPSAAQSAVVNRKLSGPMVTGVVGGAGAFEISPSGTRVVYQVFRWPELHGSPTPSRVEVAFTDGSGDPTVLSADYADVSSFRWTPDDSRVVFVATRDDGVHQVYSAPTDGSAPERLLSVGHAVAGSDAVPGSLEQTVQLTGDGSRVLYLHSFFSGPALSTVPVAGGTPMQLATNNVDSFLVSGTTVVYLAGPFSDSDLYSVPADGSTPAINLTPFPEIHAGASSGFAFDPASGRVVYRTFSFSPRALFSVPVDGSAAPIQLIPDLPLGVSSLRVSPTGLWVAYLVASTSPAELYLVPSDGSAAPRPIGPNLPGSSGVVNDYGFSPDGTHLLYKVDTDGGFGVSAYLFSARVSDGSSAALHATPVGSFQVAPDSSRVVFRAAANRLYSVPLDGGSPSVQITPDGAIVAEFADSYAVSADSASVLYVTDAHVPAPGELFEVAIEPSGPPSATTLNHALAPGGDVKKFRVAPDSSFVVYRVNAGDLDGKLFQSPSHVALSDPLPIAEVGDVSSFAARNGRVVYCADQEAAGTVELFGAPASGSAPAIKLNQALPQFGDVREIALSPDGSTVVYRADAEVFLRVELFSTASNGSSPPVKLNGPLSAGGGVSSFFRITPDGTRVVYNADQADAPGWRLRAVPIHGGVSTVIAPSGGSSITFEITPDSTHVLSEAQDHLYSVRIDGSMAPVNLSGSPRDIVAFETTPDGTRVVFTAPSGGRRRLYSNAIDGGSLLDLSAALGTAGSVISFQLSPDGERAVFFGDNQTLGVFRLMSVPVDGSSSGVVLNGPLVAGGDVHGFDVSPDGVHVVYLADQTVDQSERLYRVPIDGSAPDVQLVTQDLGLSSFAIAPDGANIVVAFNGLRSLPTTGGSLVTLSNTASEFAFLGGGRYVVHVKPAGLMRTPITGGASLALSPVPAGSIEEFVVDGDRVVYRADQDSEFVRELYSSGRIEHFAEHAPPSSNRSETR